MKKTTTTIFFVALLTIVGTTQLKAQQPKEDAAALKEEADKLKANADTSSKHWKNGGTISVNGQEVSLTNWAAGGQGAISVGGLTNLFFNYHKNKIIWNTSINLAYGVIKNGSSKTWFKTDDRIQLTSKVGREAFKKAYYSALFDFKTQFAPGYNYPNDSVKISNFMAPAYGLLALGLDFELATGLSFFVSPATERVTYVGDNNLAKQGAFGVQAEVLNANGVVVTPYKNIRYQFGGYAKAQLQQKIMENVTFGTMVEVFADYLNHPENLYVNWTTLLSMKVNKFISATFSTQLIYDPAVKIKQADGSLVGPRVQFKQVLGVGFSHKF
ncbi:MAG TPA: DUF3078 domain-containing protein [Bacteroidia bacterium]|jgi:hypothetical protein|nr:DUF3078 domain-containing protein [Bacteroidia bacterium]